jgi:hypothetical protein
MCTRNRNSNAKLVSQKDDYEREFKNKRLEKKDELVGKP